jgi:hypothetical protein
METIMTNAMEKTHGWDTCWWNDPMTNMVINYGVKKGWLIRSSVTQVQWSSHLFDRLPDGRYVFKPNAFYL